jgi:hypothetical protein
MDITYCNDQCLIGQKARDKFLAENNSAFDAAIDFQIFASKCFETCPNKAIHNKN